LFYFFKRIKEKIRNSTLKKQLVKVGLYKRTIDIKDIIGKKIVFAEILFDEFFILFEDENVFKIKTDGKLFCGEFDITKFEINEFLCKAKKISLNTFKKRSRKFEIEWNKICNEIKKDEEKKLYLKLKEKFEKG